MMRKFLFGAAAIAALTTSGCDQISDITGQTKRKLIGDWAGESATITFRDNGSAWVEYRSPKLEVGISAAFDVAGGVILILDQNSGRRIGTAKLARDGSLAVVAIVRTDLAEAEIDETLTRKAAP